MAEDEREEDGPQFEMSVTPEMARRFTRAGEFKFKILRSHKADDGRLVIDEIDIESFKWLP